MRVPKFRLLVLLILVFGVSGAVLAEVCEFESGNPEFTPDGEWILFTSNRDGNGEVYRMRPDGSTVMNLTNHPGQDMHPAALPENAGIVFDSDRDGDFEVFLAGFDGSEPRALTDNGVTDLVGRPSPDGKFVLFNSMLRGQWDIYKLELGSTSEPQLFEHSGKTEILRDWPPHDQFVPFDSDRDTDDGRRQLYIHWPDGSVTRLTDDAYDNRFARRGPPGTKTVAFTTNRAGDRDIFLIEADGRGLRSLVQWEGDEQFPSWSPDGKYLVFAATLDGSRQIYRMDTETGITLRLTGCGR